MHQKRQLTEQIDLDLDYHDKDDVQMQIKVNMQKRGYTMRDRSSLIRRPASKVGTTAAEGVMQQALLNLDPEDPKTNLSVYWDMLKDVDWYYQMAEGLSPAYKNGKASFDRVVGLASTSPEHRALFSAYKTYVWDESKQTPEPPRPKN